MLEDTEVEWCLLIFETGLQFFCGLQKKFTMDKNYNSIRRYGKLKVEPCCLSGLWPIKAVDHILAWFSPCLL